jgi:hypothetical protein
LNGVHGIIDFDPGGAAGPAVAAAEELNSHTTEKNRGQGASSTE